MVMTKDDDDDDPTTTISGKEVRITPAMAERWLRKNDSNRPISWARVQALANDMRDDKWTVTHQGICFDGPPGVGSVIDGQHRLHAIVQSGVTVTMMVFVNPGGSYQDPIDRGKPRAIGTILGMATRSVAAVNVLRAMEVGMVCHAPITLAETRSVYEHHQAVFDEVDRSGVATTGWLGGMLGAVVWAWPVDPGKVRAFAHQVSTGEMLSAGDPALAYRGWRAKVARERKVSSWDVAMASLNCIRYHLVGLKVNGVYQGESGFRALTTQRRVKRLPFTPGHDLVRSVTMKPSQAEK